MSHKPSRRPLWTLPVIALASLASCAPASSEGGAPGCVRLPVANYSLLEQRRLADEIDAAPDAALWPFWIADYGALRKAARAAQAACEGGR